MSRLSKLMLSVEELEIEENTTETVSDVEKLLEEQSIEEENSELLNTSIDDLATIEKLETAQDVIEEIVAKEESLLATPASITSTDALLSSESFKFITATLPKEFKKESFALSREDSMKDPVTALEISNENFKDVTKQIIDAIVNLYKKVKANIKVMAIRLIGYFNTLAADASKVREMYRGRSGKAKSSLTEVEIERMRRTIGFLLLISNNTFLITREAILSSRDTISYVEELTDTFKKQAEGLLSNPNYEMKRLGSIGTKNKYHELVSRYLTLDASRRDINGDVDKTLTYVPVRVTGTSVTCLVEKNGVVNMPTFSIKPEAIQKIKINALPTVDDITSLLDSIINAGKNTNDYSKKLKDVVNEGESVIDNIYKNAKNNKDVTKATEDKIKNVARNCKTVSATAVLHMMGGHMYLCRTSMNLCKMLANKY